MIKHIVIFLFCVVPELIRAQPNAFHKFESWEQVLQSAAIEKKQILVCILNSQYGPCLKMDKMLFQNIDVIEHLRKKCIVLRINTDSSKNSNDIYWKDWYKKEEASKAEAKSPEIPAYLFYDCKGGLVYKSFGLKDAASFFELVEFAYSSKMTLIKQSLLDYRNGIKNYSKMPDMARVAREYLNDSQLMLMIAKDYKHHILDKLNLEQFIQKDFVNFINDHGADQLVSLNDNFFYAAYHHPLIIDSILGVGSADRYINEVIIRDVIRSQLYDRELPKMNNPKWDSIAFFLKKKYPERNFDKVLLNEKILFYRKIENWLLYVQFKNLQLSIDPPKNVFFELNIPAWDAFLYCNDSSSLKSALLWSEMSIRIDSNNVQFLDTKANLLYKLGRKREAIKLETKAIEAAWKFAPRDPEGYPFFVKEMELVKYKMENNQQTW